MTPIRTIVLSYGMQYAMVSHMLQDMFTAQSSTLDRGESTRGRLSPWQNWRPKKQRQAPVLSVAELAECTCPELCDRDHPNE
jgi:hypothetical protein